MVLLYDLDLARKGLLWFLIGFLSFLLGIIVNFKGIQISFLLGVSLFTVAAWLWVSVSWSEDEDKKEMRAYSRLVLVGGVGLMIAWTVYVLISIASCHVCG